MKKAYSLIEIMIVIALIGALLMIAAPKYKNFIAKTRRVEAQINLHNIYAIEQSFWAENGRYTADLNELDWRPEGKPKYSYGFVDHNTKIKLKNIQELLSSDSFYRIHLGSNGSRNNSRNYPQNYTDTKS